jgi:4,5-dihydroxyphthalate decarboxylase
MPLKYPPSGPVSLKANLGDRPNTHGLIAGEVSSPLVDLDFCGPPFVADGFRALMRDGAYGFSELSIITYLQGLSFGKPLTLLPIVVMCRFHHSAIGYSTRLGTIAPRDLEGMRVGIRSYSVTTGVWIRAILQHQYGVDISRIQWVAYEPSQLEEYREPANVELIEAHGRKLYQMLDEGLFDAVISNEPIVEDAVKKPLIPDSEAATRAWYDEHRVVPINHLAAVDLSLARERPDVVEAIYGMLKACNAANPKSENGVNLLPIGLEANQRNFEYAIRYAVEQDIIPHAIEVDQLFDASTPWSQAFRGDGRNWAGGAD